jgi:glycerol-1-phosphate dehydrogenase [NAD(P)+]
VSSEAIQSALQRATDTREVVIGRGALEELPGVVRRQFGERAVLTVSDANTDRAAGQAARERLAAGGFTLREPVIFPGSPTLHADITNVERLTEILRQAPATPVAVGSGTINDLTKLAAYQAGEAYMVVATAASMDGYTAFAAAITHAGIKRVDACPAPRALVADLDVLQQAPLPMAASGYGDLLGKVIAGADWILADELGVEAIHREGWDLVMPRLAGWTQDPDGLARGELGAIEGLAEGLIMAGLAMQAAVSTRPASGSEHLFSHLWEMDGIEASHGFKVGLGTLAAASLYEAILATDLTRLDPSAIAAAWPSADQAASLVRNAHADALQAASAVEESMAKYLDRRALVDRINQIRDLWPGLSARLRAQLLPALALREKLAAAGCPVTPGAIGLTGKEFREGFFRARMIRRRYTILDFAAETGRLQPSVESLFAPGGFWHS